MILWIRVLNDRYATFRIRGEKDNSRRDVEIYACGHRKLNEYSPDGAAPDMYQFLHVWCQMPIRTKGPQIVHSDKNGVDYISGIAFGRNLWGHARNSAIAYNWALNGGDKLGWSSTKFNNDQAGSINYGGIRVMRVPVVPNGRDKLLYIVEVNNNWVGTPHAEVWVGQTKVDRFRTTFSNCFATHYNSKMWDRYIATVVPASLIKDDMRFLQVRVDMTLADNHIHFREAGTHDYN